MKTLGLILSAFLFVSVSIAQITQGSVQFEDKYESDDAQMSMAFSMMSNAKTTISFSKKGSRWDMSNDLSANSNITNRKDEKVMLLMKVPLMGLSKAVISDATEKDTIEDTPIITEHDETEEILGYDCKKVSITFEDSDVTITWFVTDQIKPAYFSNQRFDAAGIDGFPLKMVIESDGDQAFKMTSVAKKVVDEKPDDSLFDIKVPEGYEETTMEELKGLSGMF